MASVVSPRRTRSRSGVQPSHNKRDVSGDKKATGADQHRPIPPPQSSSAVSCIPATLTCKLTGLSKHELAVLEKKRQWLQSYEASMPPGVSSARLKPLVDATLVFAQEESGTAVCISRAGLLLTCSHCVAQDEDELDYDAPHWLIFSSALVVRARCIAWDRTRDLALLQISAAQGGFAPVTGQAAGPSFPFIKIASVPPQVRTPLVCAGHPGAEDLETVVPGVKTNYDVLYVSSGKYRGYAAGQDIQDNSEIGALMHDCWTYWGHSGAPLVSVTEGTVVGLHSSWDDTTGMRRGVGLEAIKVFLDKHLPPKTNEAR